MCNTARPNNRWIRSWKGLAKQFLKHVDLFLAEELWFHHFRICCSVAWSSVTWRFPVGWFAMNLPARFQGVIVSLALFTPRTVMSLSGRWWSALARVLDRWITLPRIQRRCIVLPRVCSRGIVNMWRHGPLRGESRGLHGRWGRWSKHQFSSALLMANGREGIAQCGYGLRR